AITRILEEFKKLKDKGVTNEELQEAKDGVRGSMIVQLEDSLAVADFYGKRKLLTGEIISPEEALAKIDAVTHEDIERVVKDLLVSEKLNLAVVGSFDDEERFKKLLTF
ncbi:MAG: insulinase family protein, partial [Candidatus Jacksonbacteria bacterium]|nr:insulinase family protein [Candidatus Jacksonbacteria bacterium]